MEKLEQILGKAESDRNIDERLMVSDFLKVHCFVYGNNVSAFNNMYDSMSETYGMSLGEYVNGAVAIGKYRAKKYQTAVSWEEKEMLNK